jgi:hypothetical protein
MAEANAGEASRSADPGGPADPRDRGKTVHGEAANAGHRILAPDDAEIEAYLETALKAPAPTRSADDGPAGHDGTASGTGPVVVLDFGGQFAQLIARRVRELDIYSELLPHDTTYAELERRGTRAIILSGGPMSVYDDLAPKPDAAVWSGRIPVLGICYGAQLMARERPRREAPGIWSGHRDHHGFARLVRGHGPRAAGLDEPRRFDHPPAAGLHGHGPE